MPTRVSQVRSLFILGFDSVSVLPRSGFDSVSTWFQLGFNLKWTLFSVANGLLAPDFYLLPIRTHQIHHSLALVAHRLLKVKLEMGIGDYRATGSRLRLLFQEEGQTRRLISYPIRFSL